MDESWTKRWERATRTLKCSICEKTGNGHHFIRCSVEGCDSAFHKICLDPLRSTPWTTEETEEFMCDLCDFQCQICLQDDGVLIMCDYCNLRFHPECVGFGDVVSEDEDEGEGEDKDEDEGDECDDGCDGGEVEEVGEDGEEWFCPDCRGEIESDEEWERDHVGQGMEGEREWCRSDCSCPVCVEMNASHDTWKDFEPQTPIGIALKKAIDSREGLLNFIMDEAKFLG